MRRAIHVILLFLGVAPAVWAVCIMADDPRRAGVLTALSALGLGINGAALAYPALGPRWPLRIIACGVGLAVLAGVMAMWQWIRTVLLPETPISAVARREILLLHLTNLLWIAASAAYVIVSLMILPVPPKKADPPAGRIDFRTYGK